MSQRVLRPVGENVTVQKSLGLFFCVDYSGEQMLLEHLNVQEDKRVSEWAGGTSLSKEVARHWWGQKGKHLILFL